MAVLKYYNTTTSAWEYIAASTTANFTTWKKTMAGGETSVSGTDDNAVTLSYTVGLEQVFINGVLQVRGSDYTATTGTSVTGLSALVAGDIVTVVCYAPFNIANTIAPTLVDAKGDLLVGTGADAVGRLAVGASNGQILTVASGESSGMKWIKQPAFSATMSAQTLANNTATKLNFSTEVFDTNNNYDTVNYRFTPTVAGYYFISAQIFMGISGTSRGGVAIYKNGSNVCERLDLGTNVSGGQSYTVSGLISMNGTTDYIELYGAQDSGGSVAVNTSSTLSQFNGFLASGAV
jgi:hypothetical protein